MGNGCCQKGKYNSEFGLQQGIAASLVKMCKHNSFVQF